jgi:hypothetical protein
VSSLIPAARIVCPTSLRINPRSMRTSAMTGIAEMDMAVPMNRANTSRWSGRARRSITPTRLTTSRRYPWSSVWGTIHTLRAGKESAPRNADLAEGPSGARLHQGRTESRLVVKGRVGPDHSRLVLPSGDFEEIPWNCTC